MKPRFQFRLRTLMIGIALFGLLCAIAALIRDRERLVREREYLIQKESENPETVDPAIKRRGGPSDYDLKERRERKASLEEELSRLSQQPATNR